MLISKAQWEGNGGGGVRSYLTGCDMGEGPPGWELLTCALSALTRLRDWGGPFALGGEPLLMAAGVYCP